jgi:hypothetical protein
VYTRQPKVYWEHGWPVAMPCLSGINVHEEMHEAKRSGLCMIWGRCNERVFETMVSTMRLSTRVTTTTVLVKDFVESINLNTVAWAG